MPFETAFSAAELNLDAAGEIEARDAASRRSMTDEERKNTRPDIDREDVVFAEDAGTAYELRRFVNDGVKYVEVKTDQSLFDNLTEKEKLQMVVAAIMERFGNKVVGITNRAYVNRDSAGEYAYPSKPIKDPDIREAKTRASTELDNLIETGRYIGNKPDGSDGHVHKETVAPYDYYETIFKVGNEYYKGIVNIENLKRGRRLKDVTQIENVTKAIISSYGKNPQTEFLSDISMPIISESRGNSNTEIKGLRSRFPDLTEADRQATAQAEREARYSAAEEIEKTAGSDYTDENTFGRNQNASAGERNENGINSKEGRKAESQVSGNDGRGVRGGPEQTMGHAAVGEGRKTWDILTDFQQQRATKIISDHADNDTNVEELELLRALYDGDRDFAESIYRQYQQGNVIFENGANYISNIEELAAKLDAEFNPDYKDPSARYSAAEDEGEIGEAAYDEQRAAQLQANVEALAPKELRRAYREDSAQLAAMETLAKQGGLTQQAKNTMPELRQRVAAEQSRVQEIDRKARW